MRRDVDAAINFLAATQFAAFSHFQAKERGATDRIIRARVSSGIWRHLDEAVYAIGGSPDIWEQRLMGAYLGETGLVAAGARSSAAVHGFWGFRPGPMELTVVRHKNHRSRLAVLRENRDLLPTDIVNVGGIPCTTPEFTCLELAGILGPKRLEAMIDDALASNTLKLSRLQKRFEEYARRGKPGMTNLRRILAERGPGYVPPASILEAEIDRLCRGAGLPILVRQFKLPWRDVAEGRSDLAAPWARLLVEADSRRWHTRKRDFAVDRQRDREATEHGYRTSRWVHEEIFGTPEEVVRSIRASLEVAA